MQLMEGMMEVGLNLFVKDLPLDFMITMQSFQALILPKNKEIN